MAGADVAEALAGRMDALIEAHAPGFGARVVKRWVQTPQEMEDADPSLVDGTINGGTAQLHQQLVFRPVPGTGRPETGFERLYLAGSGAHPGGGVHGAAGYLAAQAALSGSKLGGVPRTLAVGLDRALQRPPKRPFP
jgi:phytoene dehydrogenase-like protein